jgi:hypothetical protein
VLAVLVHPGIAVIAVEVLEKLKRFARENRCGLGHVMSSPLLPRKTAHQSLHHFEHGQFIAFQFIPPSRLALAAMPLRG